MNSQKFALVAAIALANGGGCLAMEPPQAIPKPALNASLPSSQGKLKKEFVVPFSGFFAGVGVSRSYYNFTNLDSYSRGRIQRLFPNLRFRIYRSGIR